MPKSPEPDLETDTDTPVLPIARPNGELIEVTVTKFGAGKVSTGERCETGDIFADRAQKMMVSKSVGMALEKSGFAEID